MSKEYLRDIITILTHIKNHLQPTNNLPNQTSNTTTVNTNQPRETVAKSTIPPPQLHADMTHPRFRKFKIDWDVYKQLTNIPATNIAAQLYHICDDALQHNVVNTIQNFFTCTSSASRKNCHQAL